MGVDEDVVETSDVEAGPGMVEVVRVEVRTSPPVLP